MFGDTTFQTANAALTCDDGICGPVSTAYYVGAESLFATGGPEPGPLRAYRKQKIRCDDRLSDRVPALHGCAGGENGGRVDERWSPLSRFHIGRVRVPTYVVRPRALDPVSTRLRCASA
jgi:hypothetical protein